MIENPKDVLLDMVDRLGFKGKETAFANRCDMDYDKYYRIVTGKQKFKAPDLEAMLEYNRGLEETNPIFVIIRPGDYWDRRLRAALGKVDWVDTAEVVSDGSVIKSTYTVEPSDNPDVEIVVIKIWRPIAFKYGVGAPILLLGAGLLADSVMYALHTYFGVAVVPLGDLISGTDNEFERLPLVQIASTISYLFAILMGLLSIIDHSVSDVRKPNAKTNILSLFRNRNKFQLAIVLPAILLIIVVANIVAGVIFYVFVTFINPSIVLPFHTSFVGFCKIILFLLVLVSIFSYWLYMIRAYTRDEKARELNPASGDSQT